MTPRANRLAAILLALAATSASAAPALTVTGAWIRPAARGAVSAGYFTVVNHGARPDRLTGARSLIAARVTLHQSRSTDGMATMRPLASVAIPRGAAITFAPGGMHLMIDGLTRELRLGTSVPITLRFAHAPPVTAGFRVRSTPS